jgi:tRNA-binding protein
MVTENIRYPMGDEFFMAETPSQANPEIDLQELMQVDMRVGRIVEVEPNPKAKQPAYILKIDVGDLGMKTSSAQLTHNYTEEELLGKQVVVVANLPPKKVAGVSSEVLVLAACDGKETILLQPHLPVKNGSPIR